jgi:predicted phosphodiesterase
VAQNSMKTVIFSDTHLTDSFNQKKYNKLETIIQNADQVIINGDFWDGMSVSFTDFLNSKWNTLFPLLLKKKTIYLYGNHDRKSYGDKRTSLFSVKQAEAYDLKVGNKVLHILHGHQIVPFNDPEVKEPLTFKKGNDIYTFLESLANIFTNGHFFLGYRFFNRKMKKYIQEHLKENEILVTGHIHAPEFDLKNRYINTFLRHHRAYYVVIENDTISFKKEYI